MFAQISNKILYQALGLQVNHKITEEVEVEVTDYSCEACKSCKNRILVKALNNASGHPEYIKATNDCINCVNRIVKREKKIITKYINEKNKYGYRPMLKRISILLLIYIHLNNPDSDGVVYEFSTKEASAVIGCNERTIKNCIKNLEEYNYIIAGKVRAGVYNIIINDYQNIYLPANKGGRGYYVITEEIFNNLCAVKTLVTLRIYIRELMAMGASELNGYATIDNKKISDIQKYLPKYCKRNVILRELMNNNSDFMNAEYVSDKNTIRFVLDSKYMHHKSKSDYINELSLYYVEFITKINSQVGNFNTGERVLDSVNSAFSGLRVPAIIINQDMIKRTTLTMDLSYLTLEYGKKWVQKGFFKFYQKYIVENRTFKNPGGIIRTFIKQLIEEKSKAA